MLPSPVKRFFYRVWRLHTACRLFRAFFYIVGNLGKEVNVRFYTDSLHESTKERVVCLITWR